MISLKFSQEFPEAVFLGVDVESLLGEAGISSLETGVRVRKCHNFGSDRLNSLKFSLEFPEAVFLGIDMESQLGEVEVFAPDESTVSKGHNFGSDRWISLKFSQEFLNAVFLGVDVESLLGEAEGSSLQTRVPVQKGHNF